MKLEKLDGIKVFSRLRGGSLILIHKYHDVSRSRDTFVQIFICEFVSQVKNIRLASQAMGEFKFFLKY